MDVFIAHQPLGDWGILGLVMCVIGTVAIALGNMIIKKCLTKE
jgi:hypothetical protein